jgi:hypothetical protein
MTARFEMGEVLLTTSMIEVFQRLGDAVLPWNSALCKCHAKGQLRQSHILTFDSAEKPPFLEKFRSGIIL